MEPDDEDFIKHHDFQHMESLGGSVHPVLLADGIHYQVKGEIVKQLPRRTERSLKAKAQWFFVLCLAGIGLFIEAYIIITTGQVKSVWANQYPECFSPGKSVKCPNKLQCCGLYKNAPVFNSASAAKKNGRPVNNTCSLPANVTSQHCDAGGHYPKELVCTHRVTGSISYTEFAGLMFGMVFFGLICDIVGRRNASLLTAVLEVIGVGVMVFYINPNLQQMVLVFSTFYGLFGIGVGGEYPLTAYGAAQHYFRSLAEKEYEAENNEKEKMRKRVLIEQAKTARRGETIALIFTMQGVGAVFGSTILLILIYFSGQGRTQCNNPSANVFGNDAISLNTVWRTFYLIGLLMIFMVLLYRWLILSDESDGHKAVMERKKMRAERLGRNYSLFKILQFYMWRLLGTGGTWFVWDITFYGLKLFSGPIFNDINPSGDLIKNNGFLLLNNVIALVGYYCAAKVIDHPSVGRVRLQAMSFAILTILFYSSGAIFDRKTQNNEPGPVIFLYFAVSFFGQFGANITTYVMAAETYPTELRATCHGLSAFMGKGGALLATIVFNNRSTKQIFFICGGASIAGFFITLLFSVDLTRLSLAEHDAQLELWLEGRLHEYKGPLNAPRHLSWFETAFGIHGEYDPDWAEKLVRRELGATDLKEGEHAKDNKEDDVEVEEGLED